jgi:sugar transferase (PEP-CTERM/EpsH1 system associated)
MELDLAAGGTPRMRTNLEFMNATIPAPKELSTDTEQDASRARGRQRLRVLHVVNRLELGGTESGILRVAAGLGGEEFLHAVCTARGHSAEFAARHSFSGQIFDATGPESRFQILVYRFAQIIRDFRPHVVHSRNWGAIEAVFAARLAGVPAIIHSEHGYELEILEGLPLRQRLFRRAAYAAADAVFTVSSDLRDFHARQAGVSTSSIDVIPNGVDSDRFAPRPQKQSACRAALGLPDTSFLVGTVGRLVPIKDQALLLRAARVLDDRGVNVSVALAGEGPELEQLRTLAGALSLSSRVHFLGASRSIPDFLNALDVFVLPSVSEGMSNTVLEAMSSGLPVIATSVGGNPELIEDQVSGRLFQSGDLIKLAEYLLNLAKDQQIRRALGAMARARILGSYRLDSMLDRYRNLYQRLASRRKNAGAQAA